MENYGLADRAGEVNRASAAIARQAIRISGKQALVIGSMGPTLFPGIDSPGANGECIAKAYKEQAEGLLLGGADCLHIEGCHSIAIARLALQAIADLDDSPGGRPAVLVSASIEETGFMLDGSSFEDFRRSVAPFEPDQTGALAGCDVLARILAPNAMAGGFLTAKVFSPGRGWTQSPEALPEHLLDVAALTGAVALGIGAGGGPEYTRHLSLRLESWGL